MPVKREREREREREGPATKRGFGKLGVGPRSEVHPGPSDLNTCKLDQPSRCMYPGLRTGAVEACPVNLISLEVSPVSEVPNWKKIQLCIRGELAYFKDLGSRDCNARSRGVKLHNFLLKSPSCRRSPQSPRGVFWHPCALKPQASNSKALASRPRDSNVDSNPDSAETSALVRIQKPGICTV